MTPAARNAINVQERRDHITAGVLPVVQVRRALPESRSIFVCLAKGSIYCTVQNGYDHFYLNALFAMWSTAVISSIMYIHTSSNIVVLIQCSALPSFIDFYVVS